MVLLRTAWALPLLLLATGSQAQQLAADTAAVIEAMGGVAAVNDAPVVTAGTEPSLRQPDSSQVSAALPAVVPSAPEPVPTTSTAADLSLSAPVLATPNGNDSTPNPIMNGNFVPNPGYAAYIQLWGYVCSGVLISPDWVLTAAHCVIEECGNNTAISKTGDCTKARKWNPDHYYTMVGGNDLTEPDSFHTSSFSQVVINPKYLERYGFIRPYDMVLLRLKTPAPAKFAPIKYNCNPNFPPMGSRASAWGWGECLNSTLCTEGGEQVTLLTTGPEGVPRVDCASNIYEKFPFPLTSWDCYLGQNNNGWASTCAGDSGGPYVMPGPDGKPLLVSLNSFGNTTCASFNGVPEPKVSAATRTSVGCAWIQSTIKSPLPKYCAPPSLSPALYDTRACANVKVGERCVVKCSSNAIVSIGSPTAIYTCTARGWVLSSPTPKCTAACRTPWATVGRGKYATRPCSILGCPKLTSFTRCIMTITCPFKGNYYTTCRKY